MLPAYRLCSQPMLSCSTRGPFARIQSCRSRKKAQKKYASWLSVQLTSLLRHNEVADNIKEGCVASGFSTAKQFLGLTVSFIIQYDKVRGALTSSLGKQYI